MIYLKKDIVKEIFSPVIKKFRRIQIQTHYKDECWSIDLIDKTILANYNKITIIPKQWKTMYQFR